MSGGLFLQVVLVFLAMFLVSLCVVPLWSESPAKVPVLTKFTISRHTLNLVMLLFPAQTSASTYIGIKMVVRLVVLILRPWPVYCCFWTRIDIWPYCFVHCWTSTTSHWKSGETQTIVYRHWLCKKARLDNEILPNDIPEMRVIDGKF